MTIQTASVAAAPTQHRRRYFAAAAGALLGLTAAAGIGAWQLGRDGGPSTREQSSAAVPVAAPVRTSTGRTGDTTPTYYLVASSAQAHAALIGIRDSDAVRLELGKAPLDQRVAQVDSAEAEAAFLQEMRVIDATRDSRNLSPIQLVDLR